MSGKDGRMIDLSAYSTTTLNTFSFLSAYFIDLFYNHFYAQAIRFHRNKQVSTITDGYKASLDAFLQNINKSDKDLYRDLVHGIHQTFIDYGFKGLTYENCIDRIVKEFVPQDYWKIISFDDKSKILGIIITNSTKSMIHKIITSHLSDVIDNHNEVENSNIWQDEYIHILIMEREKLYQQIINAKTNGGNSENSLVQLMGKEILMLSQQKNEIKQENHDLKKKLLELQKLVLILSKKNKDAILKIQDLENKMNTPSNEYAYEKNMNTSPSNENKMNTPSNEDVYEKNTYNQNKNLSNEDVYEKNTYNQNKNLSNEDVYEKNTYNQNKNLSNEDVYEKNSNPDIFTKQISEEEDEWKSDSEKEETNKQQLNFDDDDDLYLLDE